MAKKNAETVTTNAAIVLADIEPKSFLAKLVEEFKPRNRVDGASVKDDGKLYTTSLEQAGLTLDVAQRVHDHDQWFQSAALQAAGGLMLETMAAEGGPSQMTYMTQMGRNNLELVITGNGDSEPDILSRFTMVDTAGHIDDAYKHLRNMMKKTAAAEA